MTQAAGLPKQLRSQEDDLGDINRWWNAPHPDYINRCKLSAGTALSFKFSDLRKMGTLDKIAEKYGKTMVFGRRGYEGRAKEVDNERRRASTTAPGP